MDDSYFGSRKPGKRGRGASGKSKVVGSVQNRGSKAGFAKMHNVYHVSSENILSIAQEHFTEGSVAKSDGWPAYRALNNGKTKHEYVIVGSGRDAPKLLPWAHTLYLTSRGTPGESTRV